MAVCVRSLQIVFVVLAMFMSRINWELKSTRRCCLMCSNIQQLEPGTISDQLVTSHMEPETAVPLYPQKVATARKLPLSLTTLCQMQTFDSRSCLTATRYKFVIQMHLRTKVKTSLNKNMQLYSAIFPCFMSNLLLEMRHFVKLSIPW